MPLAARWTLRSDKISSRSAAAWAFARLAAWPIFWASLSIHSRVVLDIAITDADSCQSSSETTDRRCRMANSAATLQRVNIAWPSSASASPRWRARCAEMMV
ncbi:Uncharacterised protein [Mycobacteroides abscessus subsp. abscessus]|nr:Uncharacterised protein [Mycobacteroides abscessus subsp. abscessus]